MSPSKRTLWSLALALALAASALPPAAAAGPTAAPETVAVKAPAPSLWLSALLARWPGLAAWLAPEPPSGSGGMSSITAQEGVVIDPNGGAASGQGESSSPDPGATPQHGVGLDPDG
jgi:hypothetical protein